LVSTFWAFSEGFEGSTLTSWLFIRLLFSEMAAIPAGSDVLSGDLLFFAIPRFLASLDGAFLN